MARLVVVLATSCAVATVLRIVVVAAHAGGEAGGQTTSLQFVVSANPGTVRVGRPSSIDVELRRRAGDKVDASSTIPVTVTVTTLATLEAAKREVAATRGAVTKAAVLDKQTVTLPAGVRARQLSATFPRGEGDITFDLTPQTTGLVRVFVEGAGVEAGSALLAVTDRLFVIPKSRPPGDVQRVSFEQASPLVRLMFEDSGDNVRRTDGELTQRFFLRLETEDGQLAAPESDLEVNLLVTKGRARFDPRSLTIAAGQAVSRDSSHLRSRLGGEVELSARTLLPEIAAGRHSYTFEPGVRATALVVTPLSPSALANGLDEIAVEVKAVYVATGQEIVLSAADEGLDERRVSFKFSEGSARLRGGKNELVIEKGARSATTHLVASSPSRNLRIEAYSINGLAESVSGEARMSFALPWLQLISAAVGGLIVPALLRKKATMVLLGAIGGLTFYVLLFFGALVTGRFELGNLAVAVTKLPTENVLAAGVLGLIGYFATRSALTSSAQRSPQSQPAR